VWRLFTHVAGLTVLAATGAGQCQEAGRLLGRVHRALWERDHDFRSRRPAVHDTPRHLQALERAASAHRDHRLWAQIGPVADAILERGARLDLDPALPRRVVHGDPKISNVIFDPAGPAICLVDLDTFARMPLAFELGDALRSWCNPAGEEGPAQLRLDFAEASLQGYLGGVGSLPGHDELLAIPRHLHVIALELAARFCADALEERYFGWDRERFSSAAHHNLLRARVQLELAAQVEPQLGALEGLVRSALAAPA